MDGSASLDDEIRLLLYYVRNWTIWFDLQVLFQTARGLLRRPHAAMPVAATSRSRGLRGATLMAAPRDGSPGDGAAGGQHAP